ncbi:MAG TPA: translation initiation factor IF-3 [Candidatus Magasanikbacteria bacterium]|uniref:Translation initiation factor IF-3 n=1 Tax=Candidatus Magasanikbacteria bacterium GW2011_GWA2_41_55 TaxID=1619038 RepID=A0A0G0WI89_9BACT|nr:MAG: Translation initiation factor IF-3 [Candidatus Magasanikbacteria bacterium GW2011_GWA2_41_55]HBV58065.1 translation initiation factor IF-3 [Candidatus Magasanikbacteria bacterium]HBX16400.1 translation initiation factor IF-3 [Candidatus Magasanikbacteria bacterium]
MRISRYHYKRNQNVSPVTRFKVNRFITAPEVRAIDENNEHLGVMPTAKAVAAAEERGFDLVEVDPSANPPVARFIDYGHFKYEKEKEMKKQKQALKQIEIKGIRLSVRIGAHDLDMRRTQALKFLNEGNKVKIEIILRGRERQHANLAFQMIVDFITSIQKDLPVIKEQPSIMQGGKISALIAKTSAEKS